VKTPNPEEDKLMRTCYKCKHFRNLKQGEYYRILTCKSPKQATTFSPVDGTFIIQPKNVTELRAAKHLCGPGGAWWEPKAPIFIRIWNFITRKEKAKYRFDR
jgi:hypothetical protein